MIFKGLWNSERVGGLKHVPFRVYAGLLMLCDDVGLFEANAAVIHGLLFSTTPDVRLADVNRALKSIESADLVRLYEVRGKRYGCLWNYRQSKGLKRRRQEYPAPPPEVLAWQSSTEVPRITDPPDPEPNLPLEQKGTEQNRTEPNGIETPLRGGSAPVRDLPFEGVTPQSLTAYAWAHCGLRPDGALRFRVTDAAAMFKAAGVSAATSDQDLKRREGCCISALEYMAAQDQRTRWHEVKKPVALLIALTQEYRNGIGKQPKGKFIPFSQWLRQATEVRA